MEMSLLVPLLLLGCVVGFTAGLLGVGGGGILVPSLSFIFVHLGLPVEQLVHIALGTSMACIIVTSIASMRAHHQQGVIKWHIVKLMSLGILVGTYGATFIASYLNAIYLAILFSGYMSWAAFSMLANKPKIQLNQQLSGFNTAFSAMIIGAISALVSIGGGSLTVPYLVKRGIAIKSAIGTSAAVGLPISIAGTLGYVINGLGHDSVISGQMGFVYWPAVVVISISSFVFAPLGAKVSHRLPTDTLKRLFALLLVLLSVKMLWLFI